MRREKETYIVSKAMNILVNFLFEIVVIFYRYYYLFFKVKEK